VAKDHDAQRVRALFLSDVHLGTRGCQAELLLDFIRHYDADTIYLVGDIIDGWRLRSGWHWPQAHNDVVQKLLRKVRKGSRLSQIRFRRGNAVLDDTALADLHGRPRGMCHAR